MGQDQSKKFNVYVDCRNTTPDLHNIFAEERLSIQNQVSKRITIYVPKYWSVKTRAIVIKALLAHKGVKELTQDSIEFPWTMRENALEPSQEILDRLEKLPSYIEDGKKLFYSVVSKQYEISIAKK